MNEIGFKSAFDAVRFALAYSSQQYGESLMAKRLRGESTGNGMGLIGNDGAGQAGIIRRELWELKDLQLAVIVARAALRDTACSCGAPCCSHRRPNVEWQSAIAYMTEISRSYCSGFSHYRVRRSIVEKVFGVKCDLKQIAQECDAHINTVSAHHVAVRRWIEGNKKVGESGIEAPIWSVLEQRFDEIGLLKS
ncbi:DNA-binding protein [Trinickia sp.]|uniref:DNA-binding protein n=1 Tax=Trinickia sp. TaxID=2571163 RepID=UPI003F7CF0D3